MNKEQRTKFFETLFKSSKGYIELRTISPEGKVKQDWYEIEEIDRLLFELKKPYFLKTNVYFGVCPRREEKGKEENVCHVNCLWTDLDCQNEKQRKDRLDNLKTFKPSPSIIVCSGNGLHCYWLLEKPYLVKNNEDKLKAKGYLKGLGFALNGDKTFDLSRILRVPETKNMKDPKNPLLVEILEFNPTRKYKLKDFQKYKVDIEDITISDVDTSLDEIPDRFWRVLEEDRKLKLTWEGKRKDIDLKDDHSRSVYDMSLATLLMPYNFSDSELASILVASPSGKGKEAKPHYLNITIGKAKAEWEKKKKEAEEREEKKKKYHFGKVIVSAEDFLKIKTPKKKTILSPWLKEKQIILISGWRGIGKTWLALSLIDSITRNQPFGPWKIENPVNCLYLDAEMVKQDLDERLLILNPIGERQSQLSIYSSELANILGEPGPCLFDLAWQALFKEFLIKNQISLWVADNVTSLTPGLDENVKSEWDSVNEWLKELRWAGISTILIHHLGKGGSQRGTSAREDNIDISIILEEPVGYQDTDACKFNLRFTKTRLNRKELQKISDLQLQLREDEKGQSVWTYASIKKETAKEVLIRLDRGDSQALIATDLNISPARVSQIKTEAQRDKKLDSQKKLTDKGKQTIEKDDLTLLNYEK